METDIFFEELEILKNHFSVQPDEFVVSSIIAKPYKNFLIKIYRQYSNHLKEIKLTENSIISGFMY
jgi:hypothetical protein